MKRIMRRLFVVALAISLFPAAAKAQENLRLSNPFGPTVQPYVTFSGMAEGAAARLDRIDSQEEWAKLREHLGIEGKQPEVNFETCTAVAICYGPTEEPGKINMLAIQNAGHLGGLIMQFEVEKSETTAEATSPYVVLVLPKQTGRTLTLSESVEAFADGRRRWHASAKLGTEESSAKLDRETAPPQPASNPGPDRSPLPAVRKKK